MAIHIANVSFNNLSELVEANIKGKTSGPYDSTKKAAWYGNKTGDANSDGVNAVRYDDCEDIEDIFDY